MSIDRNAQQPSDPAEGDAFERLCRIYESATVYETVNRDGLRAVLGALSTPPTDSADQAMENAVTARVMAYVRGFDDGKNSVGTQPPTAAVSDRGVAGSRSRFEQAFRHNNLTLEANGEYEDNAVQSMWHGWCEATAVDDAMADRFWVAYIDDGKGAGGIQYGDVKRLLTAALDPQVKR